jgi:trehalose synthase
MERVNLVTEVPVPRRPLDMFESVIGRPRYDELLSAAGEFRKRLGGRQIWNVNSTAVGGGVAEMLQVLVGYATGAELPVRWLVIGGDPEFFDITKRLHNRIHGTVGDGRPVGDAEAAHYTRALDANSTELRDLVSPGDLVLLHDPQTAGLAGPLVEAGAIVVWRCHIGVDFADDITRSAWDFLRPHLVPAHGFVFSRASYVPEFLRDRPIWVIPPSIDPFSAKNQELEPAAVRAILAAIGVLDGDAVRHGYATQESGAVRHGGVVAGTGLFQRRDGTVGEVSHAATVVAEHLPGPADPVVVQVSRWDRLKDMAGVLRGFADGVAPAGPGYLMLVGPAVAGVGDDPEGSEVYAECVAQWRALPRPVRERALLVTLPMDDIDENAAMVNAVQRHATVMVQKSIAEGFGLTVAEGMWKRRPTVASAVGGIQDQVVDGTGILLPDPRDLRAFAAAVRALLDDPARADRMGEAAQAYVRESFVGDRHLLRYAELFGTFLDG